MSDAVRTANMQREKKAVALSSIFAAVGITAMKVVVGITTGSLGILSEAAHSGLDLVAAAVTYVFRPVSDKPADAEHQYGHGKVESFSAFVETGLLLLTCVWIVYEAGQRLFFHSVDIEPTLWAFVVMGISIVVDTWRSRKLRHHRRKVRQPGAARRRPALPHRHLVQRVVIVGLALVIGGTALRAAMAGRRPIPSRRCSWPASWSMSVGGWRARRSTRLLDAAPAGIRSPHH